MPAHHKLIFLATCGARGDRPVRHLPDLPDERALLRAVRLGLQPLLGYGGLLSFGHAAYFGMASYVSAHAGESLGTEPGAGDPVRGGGRAVLGLVIGALAIRRAGIYFAMVTLAFAQMVYFFSLQAPFTHGEDGIQAVPRGVLFGVFHLDDPMVLYWGRGDRLPCRYGADLPHRSIRHSAMS
jgi:branched-chain amino acid transport system permease protein